MNITPILSIMDTFRVLNDEKARTIARLETTIKNLKRVMRDNDIRCEDCEGDLTSDELEEGLCTHCSRLLS